MNVKQVFPMLAHTKSAPDAVWTEPTWWAQEKYDGERRLLHCRRDVSPMTGRRIVKAGGLSEVSAKVPHLTSVDYGALEGTIFDGELMHPVDFDTLGSVMRSKDDRAIAVQKEKGWLHYYVYDIVEYKGTDVRGLVYVERARLLHQALNELPIEVADYVHPVPTYKTEKDKRELLERLKVTPGAEGLIFRNVRGTYEEGKSSLDLLKYKFEFEIDAIVMDTYEADFAYTGKNDAEWFYWAHPETKEKVDISTAYTREAYELGTARKELKEKGFVPVTQSWFFDLPGGMIFGSYKQGVLTERGKCAGFTAEIAESLRDSKEKWIGRVIEVKCNGFMRSGKLRHPQFARIRDDKNEFECIWEEER